MKFTRVRYELLNPKQQEIFNFQKIAAVLADYGFNCIKLADDWQGADFLAYHKDDEETLRVQLKGRCLVAKRYLNKNLHVAFPLGNGWCLIEHDELVNIVSEQTNWLNTNSWLEKGEYHSARPSAKLTSALHEYVLT